MGTPRAFGLLLLAASLAACSKGGGEGNRVVWVLDASSTVNRTSPESRKWMQDTLNAWKLDVRLVLERDNSFTETMTGGPAPGVATGRYKSTSDGILLIPGSGTNGPLPAGEFNLKQLDRGHLVHLFHDVKLILALEGTVARPAAASGGATDPAKPSPENPGTDPAAMGK